MDHNVPRYFWRMERSGFELIGAGRLGWHRYSNGTLLAAANNAGYDALITLDKDFESFTEDPGRGVRIVILKNSNSRSALAPPFEQALDLLPTVPVGSVRVISEEKG